LLNYATSTSELAAVMQVAVKTSEKHFCRCQKFSVICGEGKVVRGNRGMSPLFLNVTRWGISDRLHAPADLLTGKSAPDIHRAGLDALRESKTVELYIF